MDCATSRTYDEARRFLLRMGPGSRVAASWVSRLPRFLVMAANTGYTPANVHFSVRSRREENPLERLCALRDATGGIRPAWQLHRLLEAMGLWAPEEMRLAA